MFFSSSLFTNHPITRRYTVWATNRVVVWLTNNINRQSSHELNLCFTGTSIRLPPESALQKKLKVEVPVGLIKPPTRYVTERGKGTLSAEAKMHEVWLSLTINDTFNCLISRAEVIHTWSFNSTSTLHIHGVVLSHNCKLDITVWSEAFTAQTLIKSSRAVSHVSC